jgi:hypothetical protein
MIKQLERNVTMKKYVRLTENELQRVMRESVTRALQQKNVVINESIDWEREIRLAQKTLCKFPLSEVGLRLEGTQFYSQFKKVRDELVTLNNSLIKYIRGDR